MRTRDEHLAWCKTRAHEYIAAGDINNAIRSMMSDLTKNDATRPLGSGPGTITRSLEVMLSGDLDKARAFIDGFE